MKTHTQIIILLVFCLLNTTCKKKIKKYPMDLYGVWYSDSDAILEIKRDGTGRIFTINSILNSKSSSGKIKFRKDHFYVGRDKFQFVEPPSYTAEKDSIEAPPAEDFFSEKLKKQRVYAKMVLKDNGFLIIFDRYQFYKYIEY
jgi:hypothetical protein